MDWAAEPVLTLSYRRAIERCNFDQARLIRHNRILAKNGIAPDGQSRATRRASLESRKLTQY